jgi:hypothetical protein
MISLFNQHYSCRMWFLHFLTFESLNIKWRNGSFGLYIETIVKSDVWKRGFLSETFLFIKNNNNLKRWANLKQKSNANNPNKSFVRGLSPRLKNGMRPNSLIKIWFAFFNPLPTSQFGQIQSTLSSKESAIAKDTKIISPSFWNTSRVRTPREKLKITIEEKCLRIIVIDWKTLILRLVSSNNRMLMW